MTRVTSRRARTGQMMLTVVPDVDTDDRAPWEGCVTGSLFDEVAPTPVTDMVGPTGRPLYRGRGILQLDVAVAILERADADERGRILDEFSTMQLRALGAKIHYAHNRAGSTSVGTQIAKDWAGSRAAAMRALETGSVVAP